MLPLQHYLFWNFTERTGGEQLVLVVVVEAEA